MTLIFSMVLLFTSCVDVKLSKEVEKEIRNLFFKDDASLETVATRAINSLTDLSIDLPIFFDEDYGRAGDVCSPTGELIMGYVSSDPEVQKKFRPFFEFYCQLKSPDKIGILQNTSILRSLACVGGLSKLLNYEMDAWEETTTISLSTAKKCFQSEFSGNWFDQNIAYGDSDLMTVRLSKIEVTSLLEFDYVLVLAANNFSSNIKFKIDKGLSGIFLDFKSMGNKTVFGVSTELSKNNLILRYDLMNEIIDFEDNNNSIINRARFFAHLEKADNQLNMVDIDFWALNKKDEKVILDQVSGGHKYGLMAARRILEIDGIGLPVVSIDISSCMTKDECQARDIKIPPQQSLYELGQVDLLKYSMDEVRDENLIYTHNNAHYRLVPNFASTGWFKLENELSYFKGSFMDAKMIDDHLYLTNGHVIKDNEIIKNEKEYKVNLNSLQVEKISMNLAPPLEDVIINAGRFENDDISIIFGGFDKISGEFLNTGKITLKQDTGDKIIFIREGELGIDWPLFHRINPIVSYTGDHIIIYGGLHYDQNYKIASVEDGLVIDLLNEKAWEMNTENAPSWATQGVWTGEYLITYGGYEVSYDFIYPRKIAHGNGAIYHLGTNSWSDLPKAPIANRLGHQLIWHKDRMIVFGGQNSINYLDGHFPKHQQGAAVFIPGVINKIYFTEKYNKPMHRNSLNTSDTTGELYVEGMIKPSTDLKVFAGSGCQSSREGEIPNGFTREFLGHGKNKITFDLAQGLNKISVLVINGADEYCTNSLIFNKF